MNPYAMTNLLRPSITSDYRDSNNAIEATATAYSVSRASFRLIEATGKLLNR